MWTEISRPNPSLPVLETLRGLFCCWRRRRLLFRLRFDWTVAAWINALPGRLPANSPRRRRLAAVRAAAASVRGRDKTPAFRCLVLPMPCESSSFSSFFRCRHNSAVDCSFVGEPRRRIRPDLMCASSNSLGFSFFRCVAKAAAF